jgi:two-component system CheB/CheR fusion protein
MAQRRSRGIYHEKRTEQEDCVAGNGDGAAQAKKPQADTADGSQQQPVVVGIGASAGGLDALRNLLRAMPEPSGMVLVVIQHLDPTHDSALTELLGRETSMPVAEVKQATPIVADHVYVIPPNRYLSISGGTLQLSEPKERRGSRMAIDHFFRSLAEDAQERSVGIVLSGTGSDGTAGLREIKHMGGLGIAQDPDQAGQSGMPQSAISSGTVDLVLRVEEMPAALSRYLQHSYLHGGLSGHTLQEQEGHRLSPLLHLLRQESGFDFRRYRKNTLMRRIQRRMGLRHLEDLSDYIHLLRDNKQEVRTLVNDLLIGVTSFFRDRQAWDFLEQKVLRELVDELRPDEPIRVWTAGCASGEEAYTLAILLAERCEAVEKPARFQIFATDISEDALATAREGLYPASIVQDVSPERLRKYFVKEESGEKYRLCKRLRETIVFASQNVLSQPPFSKLDLIICRNLLIYLEPDAQQRLLSIFQFGLREGRYLFLGTSEAVNRSSDLFTPISSKWRIYRRTSVKLPITLQTAAQGESAGPWRRGPAQGEPRQPGPGERLRAFAMEQFVPATAVINEGNKVIHLHGPIEDWLKMPTGDVSPELPDLAALARDGLRTKVRSVVHQARRDATKATVQGRVRREGKYHAVRLSAWPLPATEGEQPLMAVTFEPHGASPVDPPERATSTEVPEGDLGELVRNLEDELETTRQDLSSTIEDLETANEELKASNEEAMSMNEEMQSTNEELETSKEELESLNEELTTLNTQLETKVAELERTTDDLNNLLASTNIATVFLDTEFRIRRFTPASDELFHLIPSDVGRSIGDITRRFTDDAMLVDAEAVLRDLVAREGEVRRDDGRTFVRRIQPYRTEDRRIEGVVLTFTDVTRIEEIADRLRIRERQQAAVADLGQRALAGGDVQDLMDTAVQNVALTLDIEYCKVLELLPEGEQLLLRAGVGWRDGLVGNATVRAGTDSQAGYTLQASGPVIVEDMQQEGRFRDIPLLNEHGVFSGMSVIITGRGGPWGVLGAHARSQMHFDRDDVNFLQAVAHLLGEAIRRHEIEQELRQSRERLDLALGAAEVGTWRANLQTQQDTRDANLNRILGRPAQESTQPRDDYLSRIHPDDREDFQRAWQECVEKCAVLESEIRIVRTDGEIRWLRDRGHVVCSTAGKPLYATGAVADVTDRKRAEQALRESEERLRIAKYAADLGIHDYNVGTGDITWDQRVRELWGLEAGEPISFDTFMAGLHPEDRQATQEALERALDPQGDGRYHAEYRVINRVDGVTRWIAATGHVTFQDGAAVRLVGTAQDISERKRVEQELRKLTERLNEEVQDRTAQLEGRSLQLRALAAELTQAEHRERRRLAKVLHDHIQQLLISARMRIGLSRDIEDGQEADEVLVGAEQVINEAITSSRSLTAQLSPPVLQDGGLAEGLRWLARRMNEQHGLHTEIEAEDMTELPDDLEVFLFQSVRELLFNVVKHSGGKHARVRLARSDERLAQVVVEDDGQGFDPDALDASKMQESFGLFSIRERLEHLGGEMQLQATPGHGVRVRLTAPVSEVQKPDAPYREQRNGAPARLENAADEIAVPKDAAELTRVLIADDHQIVRQGMAVALQQRGAVQVVGEAENGLEAVEAARRLRPDVVLMDINMPKMNGLEATRRIREEIPSVAVIGLSMHEDREVIRKMRDAGAVDFIRKDEEFAKLLEVIGSLKGADDDAP